MASLGLLPGWSYAEIGGAKWGDASPVIVGFHGMGAQPAWLMSVLEQVNGKAKILVPRGLNKLGQNYAWWFEKAASADQAKLAAQMQWVIGKLKPTIAKVRGCNPGADLILVGHSQGGMLAAALAPAVLADGLIAGSAWVPESMWGGLSNATLVHGSDDVTVDYTRSKAWAEAIGAAFVTADAAHQLSGDLRARWIDAIELLV